MTDFNNIQRSQEFAQRSNIAYDQEKYAAERGTGNAIQQGGQDISHTIQIGRDRQFQQQQFQAQQANQQRQLAMEEVESASRLQEQEVQKQIGYEKLQQLTALRQSDMLKEQVRAAKLQNDSLDEAIKKQKRMEKEAGEDKLELRDERMARALSNRPEHIYDPKMPIGQRNRLATEEERKQRIEFERSKRAAGGAVTPNQQRVYYQRMYKNAEDVGDQEEMDRWYSKMEGMDTTFSGGATGQNGSTTKKPEPQTPQSKREIEKIGARIAGKMATEQKNDLASRMLRARAGIRKVMQQAGQTDATDEDAMQRMIDDLNEAGDPTTGRRAKLLALLQGLQ